MQAKHHLSVLLVLTLSLFGTACAPTDTGTSYAGSSGQTGAPTDYNGPGSAWSVSLDDDGTFVVVEAEELGDPISMLVGGTYVRYDNGFVKLTVASAEGTGAPVAGDTTVAIDVPGFAFLFQPFGASEELIPLLISGGCPATDVTTNWVSMTCNSSGASCDAESASEPFFGTFDYAFATGQSTLSSRYVMDDGSDLGASVIGTAACDDGLSEPAGAVVYLSEEPGAVIHLNPTDHDEARHMMGVPQQQVANSSMLSADYIGFVFDKNGDTSEPVEMTVDPAGTTGIITSVDPDDLNDLLSGALLATISFDQIDMVEGAAADGWVTSTYSADGEADSVMYCAAADGVGDDGVKILLCVGQSPSDTEEFYNLVLMSNDE